MQASCKMFFEYVLTQATQSVLPLHRLGPAADSHGLSISKCLSVWLLLCLADIAQIMASE